jgi:flagellar protein FliL
LAWRRATQVNEPAGKGKLKLIILIVVALLLAIGLSVGATWYFMHSAQSKPVPVAETANVKLPGIYEPDGSRPLWSITTPMAASATCR